MRKRMGQNPHAITSNRLTPAPLKEFWGLIEILGSGRLYKELEGRLVRARNRSLIVNAKVSITPKSSSVLMHQSFMAWYLSSFQFCIIKKNTVTNILKYKYF